MWKIPRFFLISAKTKLTAAFRLHQLQLVPLLPPLPFKSSTTNFLFLIIIYFHLRKVQKMNIANTCVSPPRADNEWLTSVIFASGCFSFFERNKQNVGRAYICYICMFSQTHLYPETVNRIILCIKIMQGIPWWSSGQDSAFFTAKGTGSIFG